MEGVAHEFRQLRHRVVAVAILVAGAFRGDETTQRDNPRGSFSGDQKVYVSDIQRAYRDFGWRPQVSKEEGIQRLHEWVVAHQELFKGDAN